MVVGGADSSAVTIVATPTINPEITAQIERTMSGFNRALRYVVWLLLVGSLVEFSVG